MSLQSPDASAMAAQTSRSSFWDSLAGCGLTGIKINKDQLRQRVLMPEYLRAAIVKAILTKDAASAAEAVLKGVADGTAAENSVPEVPLVVFVNSKSGGRHGKVLMVRLQELISEEQVFDLSVTKPPEFVNHGLSCLEKLAALGDQCAKATRERLRIVVAGGDGTVGWVLGSIGELFTQKRMPVPPTGIIPLGTGNDLARSFGWGGSFPFAWRAAMKIYLLKAASSPISALDSWHVTLTTKEGEHLKLPYALKHAKEYNISQDTGIEVLPESFSCYEGVFYNYFSIGMDAQVAYGFHHLREKKPYLARGPFANKMIYSSFSCTQGWFLTPCVNTPGLRGLNDILRIYVKKVNCAEWDQIPIPSSVRSIVALNLDSYGSGRHPWGHPTPKYLEKRHFVEAHSDDGLLEIFGLKQGWHASFVMVELISAKHIAQAAAIKLELRGGDWKKAYLQMDGEPWKQPLSDEYSTYINITRVPFQSRMINAK